MKNGLLALVFALSFVSNLVLAEGVPYYNKKEHLVSCEYFAAYLQIIAMHRDANIPGDLDVKMMKRQFEQDGENLTNFLEANIRAIHDNPLVEPQVVHDSFMMNCRKHKADIGAVN